MIQIFRLNVKFPKSLSIRLKYSNAEELPGITKIGHASRDNLNKNQMTLF